MATIDDIPYTPFELDQEALAGETDRDEFARCACELLKELAQTLQLVCAVARLDEYGRPRPLTRDEAIVGGLLIRSGKLLHGLLDTAAKQRVELVVYYVRGIVEAAVNVRYLLRFGTREVFDDYVRYSLRNDHKLRGQIEQNIAERRGEMLPIERRMLDGIARSFRLGEVDPASVGDHTPRSWGEGSIFRRFERLGMAEFYGAFFAMPSNHSHGNWHELYAYHLQQVRGGFALDPTFGPTPPQPLAAVAFMVADATEDYIRDVQPEGGDVEEIIRRLNACRQKMQTVETLHEQSLARDRREDN